MTTCQDIQVSLDDLLDDELSDGQRQELAMHVAQCATCDGAYQRAMILRAGMAGLAGYAERMAAGDAPPQLRFRPHSWRIAAAVMFALTAAWAAWFALPPKIERPAQPIPVAIMPDRRDEIHVADAGNLVRLQSSKLLAVQYESNRNDLKIVWIFPAMSGQQAAKTTTSPES